MHTQFDLHPACRKHIYHLERKQIKYLKIIIFRPLVKFHKLSAGFYVI